MLYEISKGPHKIHHIGYRFSDGTFEIWLNEIDINIYG